MESSKIFLMVVTILSLLIMGGGIAHADNHTSNQTGNFSNDGLFSGMDLDDRTNLTLFIFISLVVLAAGYFITPIISFIGGLVLTLIVYSSALHPVLLIFYVCISAVSLMAIMNS